MREEELHLGVLRAVYSFLFPEVRQVLENFDRRVNYRTMMQSCSTEEFQEHFSPLFPRPLNLPSSPEGTIDLDRVHEPIIERVMSAVEPHIPGIKGFNFNYPTAGSSEGLFHILAQLKCSGVTEIRVLAGEYEGFGIQGANLGLQVKVYRREEVEFSDPGGYWILSAPSARDGNFLDDELLPLLCNRGDRIVLDLTYLGMQRFKPIELNHENITHAVISLSKPYGMFRFRVGYTFARTEISTLIGNCWFKDPLRHLAGLAVVEQVGVGRLWERARTVQNKAVAELLTQHGIPALPSDSFLLAYLREEAAQELSVLQRKLIEPFKRGGGYRFCLTPYFERWYDMNVPSNTHQSGERLQSGPLSANIY